MLENIKRSKSMQTTHQGLQRQAPAHLLPKDVETILNSMVPREVWGEEGTGTAAWSPWVRKLKNTRIRGRSFTWLISAMECHILQRKFAYQAADLLNVFQTCIASFKSNRAVILKMPFSNLILSCTNHWKI